MDFFETIKYCCVCLWFFPVLFTDMFAIFASSTFDVSKLKRVIRWPILTNLIWWIYLIMLIYLWTLLKYMTKTRGQKLVDLVSWIYFFDDGFKISSYCFPISLWHISNALSIKMCFDMLISLQLTLFVKLLNILTSLHKCL